MSARRIAPIAVVLATFVLCVIAPIRATSGDAAAGRIGALVLRCGGGYDLDRYDLLQYEIARARIYYVLLDEQQQHASVYGPAPAVVGLLGVLDVGTGDHLGERALRVRARIVAGGLLALAAALLAIAALARVGARRAVLAALVPAASFAGAATLGQDLWQATIALPCLAGALAAFAWRERYPRANLATPALLALAIMIRPTIAPLALGLGIAWALAPVGRAARTHSLRTWLVAAALAAVAISPIVAWNVVHLWSPFPIGQLRANQEFTEHPFALAGLPRGVAGLLVSPARGLLWYAPIAIVGIVAALRQSRAIGGALVAQLLFIGAFYMWHGGVCFGPRFLAELVWLAAWAALVDTRLPRWLLAVAIVPTVAIGLLGLFRYDPDRWDTRRAPDGHPGALWDIVDSPIASMLQDRPTNVTTDVPRTRGYVCTGRGVRAYNVYDPF